MSYEDVGRGWNWGRCILHEKEVNAVKLGLNYAIAPTEQMCSASTTAYSTGLFRDN